MNTTIDKHREQQCTHHRYGQVMNSKVYSNKPKFSDNPRSCPIMDEVGLSLQCDESLPPHILYRKPERFRRSFVIRCALFLPRIREERLVKILCQDLAILVRHCPHCADHAPESGVLYRSRQVQAIVYDAPFRHLGCVASREKCKFGSGVICANNIEKRK